MAGISNYICFAKDGFQNELLKSKRESRENRELTRNCNCLLCLFVKQLYNPTAEATVGIFLMGRRRMGWHSQETCLLMPTYSDFRVPKSVIELPNFKAIGFNVCVL